MRKSLVGFVLALLLAMGSLMTVCAEDRVVDNNWTVSFDGKEMKETFDGDDIAYEAFSREPGDSVTIIVYVKNDSSDETDWYMTNEVIKSLEDSRNGIGGGAYSYSLNYFSSTGQRTLIYESDKVGGEKTSASSVGLHQATVGLDGGRNGEEYIYLGRLAPGESGHIELMVAMEGESQINAYQETQANLQMNFAVERTTNTTTRRTPNTGNEPEKEVIKTGDNSNVLIWSLIALLSGLVLLFAAIIKRRKEGGRQS